ncbi:thymidylate synthase [Bosea sp. 2RAB26]|uniref:thymidylate synthase n=1 Tax=Bosea sp. 2RAB26 TaxID=3237476 RepID=UPI003F9386B4
MRVLGKPFNTVSHALPTQIAARVTEFGFGEAAHFFGDPHRYLGRLDQSRLQLNSDVALEASDAHAAIKAPIAG